MYFDALTLACVADELRRTVLGGRVQKVLLPDSLSVGLEIYAQQQRHQLIASAHAEVGRIHLSTEKPRRGVDKELSLVVLLRKYVRGARVSQIQQPPYERILRLQFEHPEWGLSELVVEVMGRHSNIILVDGGGRVLDAVKRIGSQISSVRPILPAQPYQPPPAQEKLAPADLTEYRLREILEADPGAPIWKALVQGLRGISPLLAREIAFRAMGHPRAPASAVDRVSPLLQAIEELLAPLETGMWQPTIVLEEGRAVVYAPYPLTHRAEPLPVPSISEAIERFVTDQASADPYLAAKRPIREVLHAARARLQRRQAALKEQLDQAAEADTMRLWGEWILAYAHTVRPGDTELLADTGEGESLRIPLDPAKTASDNAQTYFGRYRKAQKAVEGGPARLREVTLQLDDLDQLETDLELAASRPDIDSVRAACMEAGYLRSRKRKESRTVASQPLSLTSPDGLTVLVGRNSRQNDEVTFRRADSDDWWFHARGVPGAHVIVRSGAQELPPATLRYAAGLAARFSKHHREPDVAVDYTRRRYVRRIPGAAAGLVTYSNERVIRVSPHDPDPVG